MASAHPFPASSMPPSRSSILNTRTTWKMLISKLNFAVPQEQRQEHKASRLWRRIWIWTDGLSIATERRLLRRWLRIRDRRTGLYKSMLMMNKTSSFRKCEASWLIMYASSEHWLYPALAIQIWFTVPCQKRQNFISTPTTLATKNNENFGWSFRFESIESCPRPWKCCKNPLFEMFSMNWKHLPSQYLRHWVQILNGRGHRMKILFRLIELSGRTSPFWRSAVECEH